eukprot:TRINITY_DN3163_c1_g1_i3.p1 TRINITY_DN3163_c1_g1~~TRINITY_DN3163_c1_g1_i3.p1  ORF type:complete len:506 (-),score=115.61 TRINITY_DN3163_c1_g1_i3:453-1970(-)
MVKSNSVIISVLLSMLAINAQAQYYIIFTPFWRWFISGNTYHPDFANVVEAASSTEGLGSLVQAVIAADLVDTLSDAHLEATVFAPTDDAFAAAAAALNMTVQDLLDDTETLTQVLQYHVVPSKLTADHLFDGQVLSTLAGDDLTLEVETKRKDILIKAIGSTAKVVASDVTAGAAVVHVIDTVLLPFELEQAMPEEMPKEMEKKDPEFASIVEAASSSEQLSTLVAAVQAAGLVDTLADASLEATVFAPTNEAFEAALQILGLTVEELVADVDTLTTVLTYHVVPVKALSTDLQDGQVLDTLADDLTLTVDLADGVAIQAVGSKASVITADVTAGAGVVHIIDTVLLPFALEIAPTFATIVEAAVSSDQLSTLVAAVEAAGLVETLSDPELEATVFAPTNEAFEAALDVLGLTLQELVADLETLTLVLQYHVVPTKALSTDLEDGQTLDTLAEGLTLTVDLSEEGVVAIQAVGSKATVVDADITAGAGVVHVIDTVLLPLDPSQ